MKKKLTITKALESLSQLVDLTPNEEKLLEDKSYKKALIEQYSKPQEIYRHSGIVHIQHTLEKAFEKVEQLYLDCQYKRGELSMIHIMGEAVKKIGLFQALMQRAYKGVDRLQEMGAHYHFKRKRFSLKACPSTLKVQRFVQSFANDTHDNKNTYRRIHNLSVNDVYLSMQEMKSDELYELLYLKKKQGHRFFEHRLKNSFPLHEEAQGKFEAKDPFLSVKALNDERLQLLAGAMLKSIQPYLLEFYRQASSYNHYPIIKDLHALVMALKLASHKKQLSSGRGKKCCYDYFLDFLVYLRKVLQAKDYQSYLKHPPRSGSFFAYVLTFIHQLCLLLYTEAKVWKQERLLKYKKAPKKMSLSEGLLSMNEQMEKVVKAFPNGPLFKMLDYLNSDFQLSFDPIFHLNLPHCLYTLQNDKQKVKVLRLPSPTAQEFIHRAKIVPEFLGFLNTYKEFSKTHLLINVQNRKNWVEKARCNALEQVEKSSLSLMSYGLDSDFLQQYPPYQHLNQAQAFKSLLLEKLKEGEGQFFFSSDVESLVTEKKLGAIVEFIHKHLFFKAKVLSRQERCHFIDLFLNLLTLYIMGKLKPESISFTCKDGLDQGMSRALLFSVALKVLSGQGAPVMEDMQKSFQEYFHVCLLVRERLPKAREVEKLFSNLRAYEGLAKKLKGKEHLKDLEQIIEVKWDKFYLE